ncbi:60S acidic ribosomal protein P2 [Habropoda laboriosa]|uniref:Large ribosomal subunit protein P2 n=1 Tax=Habropoda laboriosa TaxID=597456 RepID=A0A0L7REM3_9HYME|nr:PREDICTED: 60S acidic ribosomal protein P2 [Habropoda laboriosa]KOC69293.1 60S acidic ribosomal protein P2 [Habropoda laboriosa]
MRYVAAYLLASLGKPSPTQYDIEKILSSVGIEADEEKINKVVSELNGKSVDEYIALGRTRLLSMPIGGAAAATVAVAPVGGTTAPAEEKKEEKKPAKEESESEDEDMGFGLFD